MKKTLRVLLLVAIFFTVFAGTAGAYEVKSKQIELTINGSFTRMCVTSATNVGEFLEEAGVQLGRNQEVNPPVYTTILTDMKITIDEIVNVPLLVDGQKQSFETVKTTVGSAIEQYAAHTGLDYEYDLALANNTADGGTMIELRSKESKQFETIEPITFEIEYINTQDLSEGNEQVVQEGVDGQRKLVMQIDYLGGEEVGRTIIEDTVIAEPVKKIIHVGTAKIVPIAQQSTLKYKRELVMSATAYTSNYECTGKRPGDYYFGITASGMKAREGIVAVDPNVIPLGTRLYIEGYGEAIAGDTGGAIKGNKIDLYFDTYEEVLAFGRQSRKVYVLE